MFIKMVSLFISFFIIISCEKNNNEIEHMNKTKNLNGEKIVFEKSQISENQLAYKEPALDDFINYLQLSNCNITYDYSVPNIINRIIGIEDDEAPRE